MLVFCCSWFAVWVRFVFPSSISRVSILLLMTCAHRTHGVRTRAKKLTILTDPIWDTLRECNSFQLVVRQCLVQAEHKGQQCQRAKAISVPAKYTNRVLQGPSHISLIADTCWLNQASIPLAMLPGSTANGCKSSSYPTPSGHLADVVSLGSSWSPGASSLDAGFSMSATPYTKWE